MSLELELEPPHCVGLVGASARAAAFSALRAGLLPYCWDLFADTDLASVAEVQKIPRLSDDSLFDSDARRGLPLMQVGGMENLPEWLARATATGPVWANTPQVVLRVRDPIELRDTLTPLRLPIPEVRPSYDPPDADGAWLLKPIASGGGRGIVRWTSAAAQHPTLDERHVFQKFVSGQSYSAVFVGLEPPGDVNFVGISRQIVGWPLMNAGEFAWCGSVGPASLDVPTEHMIRRIGNILMWKFQLRGLFGCDFIVDSDGTPWLIEVNPRYPASAEIFELACGFTLLRSHAAAFGVEWNDSDAEFETYPESVLAKGVLFAPADFEMPALDQLQIATPYESVNRIADVSAPGTLIRRGEPVCTLLVDGIDDETATHRLEEAAREFLLNALPEA
ncbi:MAG TPA: ATP-grasp domain-containing protein [Caulifigura sp.]|jgi:predicted ATP-grasp superfamily ATP-dependent carboligase|nr:ATP-grasp domain-containing protein [Caulifigura sp.]